MNSAAPPPFLDPFTLAELRQLGLGRAQLDVWLRAGMVKRVGHGVYLRTDVPDAGPLRRACFGGCRIAPLSFSAKQLGLWIPPKPGAHTQRAQRVERVPAKHLIVRNGVTITDIPWTCIGMARGESLPAGLVCFDSALRLGAARPALEAVTSAMRGRPGTALLPTALRLADDKSESALEAFARGRFFELGLPAPVQQLEVTVQGRRFRPDFAWPNQHLIAEADGEAKYSNPEEERRQRYRQHLLHEAGWEVLRFGWPDLRTAESGFLRVLERRLRN